MPITADGESEGALLRNVAQAAPVVLWSMDVDGNCTLSMGRGLKSFGLTDHELEGSHLPTVFNDATSTGIYERAMSGESFRVETEIVGRHFVTWIEPLGGSGGQPLRGAVGVTVDVTAERAREALEVGRMRERATLLHYLLSADENDRRAVAQELHDDVIQLVTGLSIQVDLARRIPHDDTCQSAAAIDADLRSLEEAVESAAQRLRGLVGTLEPLTVEGAQLGQALIGLAKSSLQPLGIECSVEVAVPGPPDVMARVLYRVVQEALTNVVRHSKAHNVRIAVTHGSSSWRLVVRDDGVGAVDGYTERLGHRGLRGMRERVELASGTMQVGPGESSGTRVVVELPTYGVIAEAEPAPDELASTTLARVLSAMHQGLAVFDREWRVVFMNETACRLLGLVPGEWGDEPIWQVLPSFADRPSQRVLMRAMEESTETTYELPWGDRWLLVHAIPSTDGLVLMASDRTEWHALQERVAASSAQTAGESTAGGPSLAAP